VISYRLGPWLSCSRGETCVVSNRYV